MGLYVPREVLEVVISDFEARRARIEADLQRRLDKYPHMPSADISKLHIIISSHSPDLVGKAALNGMKHLIYSYVRDRYTIFKTLKSNEENSEAFSLVHRRVRELLASWSGEDEPLASTSENGQEVETEAEEDGKDEDKEEEDTEHSDKQTMPI